MVKASQIPEHVMTRAVCILSLMHTPSEQFYTDAERSACLASSTGETLDTSKSKVKIMEIPKETKAAVKPALWGAAAGAIALAIVGFNWGGWVTVHPRHRYALERHSPQRSRSGL